MNSAKAWIGTSAGIIAILSAFAGAGLWMKQNVAWAEDMQRTFVIQSINVQQIQVDTRKWRIKHDLRDIEDRQREGEAYPTDQVEKTQLLQEQAFLLQQKARLTEAESMAYSNR